MTPGHPTGPVVPGAVRMVVTAEDVAQARLCGDRRLADAERWGYVDKWGTDMRASHRVGALGEVVFCRWVGIPFECASGRTKTLPDQGGAEVRTSNGWPMLKMRPDEVGNAALSQRPWYLVRVPKDERGVRSVAYIEGFIYGWEVAALALSGAIRPGLARKGDTRPAAFFVPPRYLHW